MGKPLGGEYSGVLGRRVLRSTRPRTDPLVAPDEKWVLAAGPRGARPSQPLTWLIRASMLAQINPLS